MGLAHDVYSPSIETGMVPAEPLYRQPDDLFDANNRLSQSGEFRSRREVIDQIEREYDAKVLKISLDRRAGVYEVRILQANGRVRDITVSARS